VFAVVDYAEGRQEELIAFLKALQDGLSERRSIPVRLMLLARGLGEWYDRLHEQDGAQDLLPTQQALNNPTKPKNRKLNPPSTLEQPEDAKAEFRRALEVFAQARGKSAPTRTIDLSSDLFKRVLFVHMAALLVVEGETLQNPTQSELLGAVLAVERKYWRSRMNKEQENLIPALERTMTLVTLGYPVPSLEAANALLDLDRNLSKLDVNGKDPISNLLHDTYPGVAYINPIEPDLLAEHLIYTQLTHDQTGTKLIETAFGQAGSEPDGLRVNPDQALGHLVRLAEWRPETLELWRAVFTGRLNNTWGNTDKPLLLTAMQIARENPSNGVKLGNLLAELLEELPDRNLAIQAEAPLLTYSVNLLNLAEVVLRLVCDTNDEVKYAENLDKHAHALGNLGRFEEAFAQAREAGSILRRLWHEDPDTYRHALALNLNNQSTFQSKLDDRHGALKTITEAVQVLRKLSSDASMRTMTPRPTLTVTFEDQSVSQIEAKVTNLSPELATSLANLSNCQSAVGDLHGALESINEAVWILDPLASVDPDGFLPRYASCLLNQSNRQGEAGDLEDALETMERVVQIRRDLVRMKPDQFIPDLAMSLNNLSTCQRVVGDRYGALEAINETIEIYLQLVQHNPDIFTPNLARAYHSQGEILVAVQKPFEALKSFAEGIRQLTPYLQRNPQTSVDLAQHLMRAYRTLAAKILMREDPVLLRAVEEVIGSISTGDNQFQKILKNFEPFLQAMAAVVLVNDEPRAEIEELLVTLEENGWKISDATKRIWAGERDSTTLESGLDSQDSALVHRILEIIQNASQT
jgi:tetratricopeptide (TPR) repeat protein